VAGPGYAGAPRGGVAPDDCTPPALASRGVQRPGLRAAGGARRGGAHRQPRPPVESAAAHRLDSVVGRADPGPGAAGRSVGGPEPVGRAVSPAAPVRSRRCPAGRATAMLSGIARLLAGGAGLPALCLVRADRP